MMERKRNAFEEGRIPVDFSFPEARTLPEIVGTGIRETIRHARLLPLIVIPPFLPVAALGNYVGIYERFQSPEGLPAFIVYMLLELAANALVTPTLVYALSSSYRRPGEGVSLSEAWRWGFALWPRVLVFQLGVMLLTSLGLMLFILPGVYVFIRLLYVEHLVALEGSHLRNPIKKGFELTGDRQFQLFGAAILLMLALWGLGFVIASPFAGLESWVARTLLDCLIKLVGVVFPVTIFLACLTSLKDSLKEEDEWEEGGN